METNEETIFLSILDSQTEDDVIVKWGAGNRGVIVPNNLEIPQFDISKVVVRNRNSSYNTGLLNKRDNEYISVTAKRILLHKGYNFQENVFLSDWLSLWFVKSERQRS